MRRDLYKEMYQLEEKYWWHIAKRILVNSLIVRFVGKTNSKKIADVGCGTGKFMEEQLENNWSGVVGLDGSKEALKFCRQRGLKNCKISDFEKKLDLKKNSTDVLTSLDVVEHIENDENLASEMMRVLKPGGHVFVTVPAHMWLWTYWDEMLSHKRRYSKKGVEDLFINQGFEVVFSSYFYSYLLPLALIVRSVKRFSKKEKTSDFFELPVWVNNVLVLMAKIEVAVLSLVKIPFGLSVVLVARKPRV